MELQLNQSIIHKLINTVANKSKIKKLKSTAVSRKKKQNKSEK